MDEGGCSEAQSQPPLVDWQAAATSRSSARCCASVSVPWSSRRDRKLIVRAAAAGSASQDGVDVAFVMAFSAAVVVVVVGSVAEPRRRVQVAVVVAAVVTAAAWVTAADGWCCCLLGGAGRLLTGSCAKLSTPLFSASSSLKAEALSLRRLAPFHGHFQRPDGLGFTHALDRTGARAAAHVPYEPTPRSSHQRNTAVPVRDTAAAEADVRGRISVPREGGQDRVGVKAQRTHLYRKAR